MAETTPVTATEQSAYALDLEMSLLLPSCAPAAWSPAVHEAARLLVGRPWEPGSEAPGDLLALAFVLFARTHTGDRAPRDVPVAELRQALSGPPDREPRIIDEIARALTETGQSHAPGTGPLWGLFDSARNQYGSLGGSLLADDVEPPRPGPSPLRAAAARLSQFLAGYPDQLRDQSTAPRVASGPLVIEAPRFQLVTGSSIMPLRCPRGGDDVLALRVDGPQVTGTCSLGHTPALPRLDAAHVRMAVARATGARPWEQGLHVLPEMLITLAPLARHSDPMTSNIILRASPLVGRDDVLGQIKRIVTRRN